MRWENTRKYITYTTPDSMKCRDNKLHEEKYCKEAMEHEFRIRAEIVSARNQAAQHPAGSTSDADNASRSVSLETDWEQMMNDLDALPDHANRQTDLLESVSRQMSQLPTRTQLDELLESAASGADDRTGWEAEREFVFLCAESDFPDCICHTSVFRH